MITRKYNLNNIRGHIFCLLTQKEKLWQLQKKAAAKKRSAPVKNKLGVKNSLVNNINAKKKAGTSNSEKKSTVSKKSYQKMENNWGKTKK
ncbi:MAG: hypothetical protein ABJB86_14455 [Bacteroidota bacterium]